MSTISESQENYPELKKFNDEMKEIYTKLCYEDKDLDDSISNESQVKIALKSLDERIHYEDQLFMDTEMMNDE